MFNKNHSILTGILILSLFVFLNGCETKDPLDGSELKILSSSDSVSNLPLSVVQYLPNKEEERLLRIL